jgi:hypothetical protein
MGNMLGDPTSAPGIARKSCVPVHRPWRLRMEPPATLTCPVSAARWLMVTDQNGLASDPDRR